MVWIAVILLSIFGALAFGTVVLLYDLRAPPPKRLRVTVPPLSGDEWKADATGDPDGCGTRPTCPYDCPDCPRVQHDEPPSKPLPTNLFGVRLHCAKCASRNAERNRRGLDPLPQHIRVRVRDSAVWCFVHDEGLYRMSDDAVMRYDPRFHQPRDDE